MRWLIDGRTAIAGLEGGVARVATALCDALIQESGAGVTCVTTGWHRSTLGSPALQAAHLHISYPNKLWSMGAFARVASLTASAERRVGKCDAAFFPNIGFSGTITVPYALLLHDLTFLIEPSWFPARMRLWHRAVSARRMIIGANRLFAVSETTKRDAAALLKIPTEKITVLPIGPTASENRNAADEPRPYHFPYVLVLGSGDRRKNTTVAAEAVQKLRTTSEWHDLHLIVVGRRPHDLKPWMVHESRVDDARLRSLYRHARAFLYPSWYEGYGLPLWEAHAVGLPSVAGAAGALPETAPPGTIFADPAKPHHWVEALRHALTRTAASRVATDPPGNWNVAAKLVQDALVDISSRSA